MRTLIEKGGIQNINPRGRYFERAIARAQLSLWGQESPLKVTPPHKALPPEKIRVSSIHRISIGFPRMMKEQGELRVFLPELIAQLTRRGAVVSIEEGYGSRSGLSFADFHQGNDAIRSCSREEAFQQELVIVFEIPDAGGIQEHSSWKHAALNAAFSHTAGPRSNIEKSWRSRPSLWTVSATTRIFVWWRT